MAHFYGTLKGARGEATRCGTKNSGVTTYAAGWGGAIKVEVRHIQGMDHFVVQMVPWRGTGDAVEIAYGIIGEQHTVHICEGSEALAAEHGSS